MEQVTGRSVPTFQDRLVQSLNSKEADIQGLKVQVATLHENLTGRDTCLKYVDTEVSKLIVLLKLTVNNNSSESADHDGNDTTEVEFSTLLNISGGDLFEELAQTHFRNLFSEISGTVETLIVKLKKAEHDLQKTREQIGNLFRMADSIKSSSADSAAAAAAAVLSPSPSVTSEQTYSGGGDVVTTTTGNAEVDSTSFGGGSQIQESATTSATFPALAEIHSEYVRSARSGENGSPSNETPEAVPMETDRSTVENTTTSDLQNDAGHAVDANSLPYSVVVKVEPCVTSQIAIARAKLMEFRGPPRKCKITPPIKHAKDVSHPGPGIFCLCGIYFITTNAFDRHCMRSKNKEWSASLSRPTSKRRNVGRRKRRTPYLQTRKGKRNRAIEPKSRIKFSCEICSTELSSVTVVKTHKKNVHGIDDTVFKIGCRICGHICFSREEFAKHRMQEHGTSYGKKSRQSDECEPSENPDQRRPGRKSRTRGQSQNEYFGDLQSEQIPEETSNELEQSDDTEEQVSADSPPGGVDQNISNSENNDLSHTSGNNAPREMMFSCTVCNADFRSRGCLKVHMARKHGSDMPKANRKNNKRKQPGRNTTIKKSAMSQTSPPPPVDNDGDGTEMDNSTSESHTTTLPPSTYFTRFGMTQGNNMGRETPGSDTEPPESSTFVATIPLISSNLHTTSATSTSRHPINSNESNAVTTGGQIIAYPLGDVKIERD